MDSLPRSLPSHDPINAQKVVCAAISQTLENTPTDADQLEALYLLDRRAQLINRQLLERYVEGNAQLHALEQRVWNSASRLSQSLVQAYESFLRHLQNNADVDWLAHAPTVLVRLFYYRHIQFLLRSLRFKKRIPGQWKDLHETYKFAQTRGMTMQQIAVGQTDDKHGTPATLEEQYLRILLLEMMSSGQFSPRDALWADGWFGQWCKVLRLQVHEAIEGAHAVQKVFVVDLDDTDGLKRATTAAAGTRLFLDTSPMLALIDDELESLRDHDSLRLALTPAVRAGQVALLNKLKTIFDPDPVCIARRGERKPVAFAVQAITSLTSIIYVLREEAKLRAGVSASEPELEGITSSLAGAETCSPSIAVDGAAGPAATLIVDYAGVAPAVWQVRDRSDSGSRIRGKINDLNRIIPGSLIAIREGDDASWTVSVVRRFRRLMIDYVEIGVEHIGRRPRIVKLVAERSGSASIGGRADSAHGCFAALYLPPSERQPTIPIKTLLLPARNFKRDCNVTLLSSNATYTLRLSAPIQQQFEFIWTSFTVVDKAPIANGAKSIASSMDARR